MKHAQQSNLRPHWKFPLSPFKTNYNPLEREILFVQWSKGWPCYESSTFNRVTIHCHTMCICVFVYKCICVFVYLLQPAQGFSVLRESQSWSHRPAGKLVKMWKMQWLPPWAALACQQHHNSGFPAHILDHFWLFILTEFCSHALPYFLTWFSSSLKTLDAKPKTIEENTGPADDLCF